MQYLTPSELRNLAPAAQKMPDSDDKLIDTKAFLRQLEADHGFRPVFAAQGKAHTDVESPLKSRHLVVTKDPSGFAIALLNSHTIWRRAWMMSGFSNGKDLFLIGAAAPLPRWRGTEAPLHAVLSYKDALLEAKDKLEGWRPDVHQTRWMAKKYASMAYIKGHRRPVSKELQFPGENAWTMLISMFKTVKAGGLAPEPVDSFMPPRKIKPIIAPDALLLASNAAFMVGCLGLERAGKGVYSFPPYVHSR